MLASPSSAILSRASVVEVPLKLGASCVRRVFLRARGGFGREVGPRVLEAFITPWSRFFDFLFYSLIDLMGNVFFRLILTAGLSKDWSSAFIASWERERVAAEEDTTTGASLRGLKEAV